MALSRQGRLKRVAYGTVAVAATTTRSAASDPSTLTPHPAGGGSPPRVWVLAGQRAGDRAQMIALAEALGWPHETKQLMFSRWHYVPNLIIGPSLMSIDRRRSAALEPPWPDLVISAGKRSVPVAFWIRTQSERQVRLVHFGRPWAPMRRFDLIVTSPQYGLPERPNLVRSLMPLHGMTRGRLADAAAIWAPRLSHLPRPLTGLLLGGNSPTYRFSEAAAIRLALAASDLVQRSGGSLLVTSSSRTPGPAIAAIEARLTCPHHIHRWRPHDANNPYPAILALAESFIVTGDSASLLAEACSTGRPVQIFDLPRRFPSRRNRDTRSSTRLSVRLAELGVLMPGRDMSRLHAALIDRGLAVRVGDKVLPPPGNTPDELAYVLGRVRALLGES